MSDNKIYGKLKPGCIYNLNGILVRVKKLHILDKDCEGCCLNGFLCPNIKTTNSKQSITHINCDTSRLIFVEP